MTLFAPSGAVSCNQIRWPLKSMSISIYYSAARSTPLTDVESSAIDAVVEEYSVDDQITAREQTGVGPNWESFCVYDRDDAIIADAIFVGATKLPDNSEDAMWVGLQHWCKALSAIRRVLPNADWHVHIDDHDMQWDDAKQEYDPSA